MAGRILDNRAFIGALALLIVGVVLALMVAFYVWPNSFDQGILVARWWWEIVLNLQILCLAFMWFCHHERIIQAEGRWRVRAIGNLLVGWISVSYPIGVLLISAWFDWFRHAPSLATVRIAILAGVALWAVGSYVMPLLYWLMMRSEGRKALLASFDMSPLGLLRRFWPTAGLVLVLLSEAIRGGAGGYILVPLFMYSQGAMPYLRKARHASPRDADF